MLKTVPPNKQVRAFAQDLPTEGISVGDHGRGRDCLPTDTGLVKTLLQLLEQCEDETFADVLRHCGSC